MKKIVVAIDSFKGCLDSLSASKAFASGIADAASDLESICVPVADGGEGMASAIAFGKENYRPIFSRVHGPLGSIIEAEWYLDSEKRVALIDMAAAAGLGLLQDKERNPMYTTSFGLGELMIKAADAGAERLFVGLGGSATVDAGLGACMAVGLVVRDKNGKVMSQPFVGKNLKEIGDFDVSGIDSRIMKMDINLLCDVRAPFTGETGASVIFGPQKGASVADVEYLESGMENVRMLIKHKLGIDLNMLPGSGSAGGAAGGLYAMLNAKISKGAASVLDVVGFNSIIEGAVLIVTGEGSADAQTLMGKLPCEILRRGIAKGIPVIIVAGIVKDKQTLLQARFAEVVNINSDKIVEQSETQGLNPLDAHVAEKRLRSAGLNVAENLENINLNTQSAFTSL